MSYLDDYTKIPIEEFKGLYRRGMADQCPPDHATCCENVFFSNSGQVGIRPGTKTSLALNHPVKRIFEGASNGTLQIFTMDWNGNIYINNNPTPVFSDPNAIDFVGLNLFNKVFILPIGAAYPPPNMQVWLDTYSATRNAAGLAPTATFNAASGGAGDVAAGDYKIAVSFITDTGFTTQPGPKIASVFTPVTYTSAGADSIALTNIPLGGPEVVGRQIFITKANSDLYYYVGQSNGGLINDNTTTTATLDFFDSDLVITADDLFDLLETIPGAVTAGGLNTYHNRLVVVRANADVVYISYAEDAESMNNVTGFLTLPADSDEARGCLVLRDACYITRAFSIFATQDNGNEPGDWELTLIDGAIGSGHFALGSIAATLPSLTTGDIGLVANEAGLFMFNGSVIRPELSWKIKDVWNTVTKTATQNITTQIDPFAKILYILLPTNGSTDCNLLLVADFNNGWDYMSLRWTYYFFRPFVPASIGLCSFLDDDGDFTYRLRIGSMGRNELEKLDSTVKSDLEIYAIKSYYTCALLTAKVGSINVLRALRFRARGNGSLILKVRPEDMQTTTTLPPIALANRPERDYLRQLNFQNEKFSVEFGTDAVDHYMEVDRLDEFAMPLFGERPGIG